MDAIPAKERGLRLTDLLQLSSTKRPRRHGDGARGDDRGRAEQ